MMMTMMMRRRRRMMMRIMMMTTMTTMMTMTRMRMRCQSQILTIFFVVSVSLDRISLLESGHTMSQE